MKKWKVLRKVTIILFIILLIAMIVDVIICINMEYPHPMLGIDAHNWFEQFKTDFILSFSLPLIIDIILFIISHVKIIKKK